MSAVGAQLRTLKPQVVIESSVWKGGDAWLIEQAARDPRMNPIASNSLRLHHEFLRAEYLTNSFDCHDWRKLPNNSLVLYDDN